MSSDQIDNFVDLVGMNRYNLEAAEDLVVEEVVSTLCEYKWCFREEESCGWRVYDSEVIISDDDALVILVMSR